MFRGCPNLTTFASDLSSLTNGYYMFYDCDGLTSFTSDLSSLTQGTSMFPFSTNLKYFNSDLSSLEKGTMMFEYCSQLREFWCDLPSLTDGSYMFSDCWNLISFTSGVPLLSNGKGMFDGCSKLTTFTSSLSNLDSASKMFKGCSLNQESIYKIANTIKDVSSIGGGIYIGNSPDVPTSVLEECGNIIYNKGWNVFFNDVYKAKIDITAENGFVPDASKWNEFILSNLPDRKITSVSDGKLFANAEVIGIIDSDNITDGSHLMSLSYIESWDVPLTKLTNGDHMFYACNLSEFNVPLTNLTYG